MQRIETVIRTLASDIGARPVGTAANDAARRYLTAIAEESNFIVSTLPFDCLRWERGPSSLSVDGRTIAIHPGPFSPALEGTFTVAYVSTIEELRSTELTGKLIVVRGALAEEPLMPKDFPFYYPDNHKEIIDLIERGKPAGVLAVTGKHPMCGWNPFPLFEDGNLGIANAFCSSIRDNGVHEISVTLNSSAVPSTGEQIIVSRNAASKKRVVLCAHMDTKYETPGALDNASGVATLVGVMERLAGADLSVALDVVPFNGEEYFAVPGQLAYLRDRKPRVETTSLVINVDGLGHIDSRNAYSYYNASEEDAARIGEIVEKNDTAVAGEQWVAGDHAMFAFQGVPCVAVTSSNLMETVLDLIHTAGDTVDNVDGTLIETAADTIAEIIRSVD
ncbi:MAG: M28 family peptidase [Spirochaetales bacterium]|nr:M28 family peptidase [Spirochaetales bacterium]